jgi:DNA repair exonuclease SbcCD nuclease subunit
MFKFLHAADIHLDSALSGLDRYDGAPADAIRGATRRALENLVRLALEERVAFVLIAGDLYDGDWPDYHTGLFFAAQMARLREAGIPVYLIQGNHDAANRMTRQLRLPDRVVFLSHDRPETRLLDDCGVAIHGQGFATRAVVDNLAVAYPGRVPGAFNIGVLHTAVDGREGHDRYAPCTVDDMRHREYDYWALGHIHKREELHKDPWIVFPGNIQGRHIRESGPKGCVLVTVDGARVVSAEPQWLDVVRWDSCRVDATGAIDGDDILDRFRARLAELGTAGDGRLLALRVEVCGPCRAHARVVADWAHWTNEVRQAAIELGGGRVWVEKVQARTSTPAADRDGAGDGPVAELIELLHDLRDDDLRLKELGDREFDDLRRRLPGDLLDGLDTPARLRELLDEVGPLLLTRLGAGGGAP